MHGRVMMVFSGQAGDVQKSHAVRMAEVFCGCIENIDFGADGA